MPKISPFSVFTGIIAATAEVLERSPTGLRLARPASVLDLQTGASIAIAGVCLTVTKFDAASMDFDVVGETWKRTTLGTLEKGSRVNLEQALRADGRLDGHVVQGHVEGVGEVTAVAPNGEITIRIPADLLPFAIPKGSICLDGASLTIARIEGDSITVALIPETLARTTFGLRKPGDHINVETDILIRAVLNRRKA